MFVWVFASKNKTQPQNRRQVKDVLPGDKIAIESIRFRGGIGVVRCLNNDVVTNKILIGIQWGNFKELGIQEHEQIILHYDGFELRNFHLLNQYPINVSYIEDVDSLKKQLEEGLQKEDYENAKLIQEKIDKLSKK